MKGVCVMSTKKEQVEQLTTYMANFVSYIGKVLPDDIIAKLDELAEKEDSPLSKVIYQTMKRNQVLAKELNRPSCQDTGVLQFWVKCGTKFPLIGELEPLLKEAVVKATFEAPLRHNSVETFDEYILSDADCKHRYHLHPVNGQLHIHLHMCKHWLMYFSMSTYMSHPHYAL